VKVTVVNCQSVILLAELQQALSGIAVVTAAAGACSCDGQPLLLMSPCRPAVPVDPAWLSGMNPKESKTW
jgi:hypothetical protein